MVDLRGYFRQARTLPLDQTLRKAVRLIRRSGRSGAQLARDMVLPSHGARRDRLNASARVVIGSSEIPGDLVRSLRDLGKLYLQGRFDILGSGWVSPAYGFDAPGFLGHRFGPAGPAAPLRDGRGLEAVVNRANLQRARDIWRLIRRPDHVPIDWQRDVRSGFRWTATRPSVALSIPVDTGADIKVPWELARLQHLPQLALCAVLARAQTPGFLTPETYVDAISDHLVDFLAANPPRFGVNWVGTMEVAIRAANMALTMALLSGGELRLSDAVSGLLATSLHDHAAHIVEHLEYSETARTNHYLADLGGLLWAAWLLADPDADTYLVFAIAELLAEADHQFLSDGGNYEGSTNYHRLSGEIVAFAVALIASLDAERVGRLTQVKPPRRDWRVSFPTLPLPRHGESPAGDGLIPAAVLQKLRGGAMLSRTVQGGDGTVVQIGDTDSGRFFNLHPRFPDRADGIRIENTLDHLGFVAATEALFSPGGASRLDGVFVARLVRKALDEPPPVPAPADFGDVEALLVRWRAAPERARRHRRIKLAVPIERWSRTAFPHFGLYVFRHEDMLVAFRCAEAPPSGAPRGHRHDDNLGLEYRLRDVERRDPGSFVYTPSIAERNAYRSAAAHDVPRMAGIAFTSGDAGLFEFDQTAHGRCVYWRRDGVAGEVVHPAGTVLRLVLLSGDTLEIYDCVSAGELAEASHELPVSFGYGRR